MGITIDVTDIVDDKVRQTILEFLLQYNAERTGHRDQRPLAVLLSDQKREIIGGLLGRTGYGWLFVEIVFVPPSLRTRGLGRELMLRAEAEAIARGCHSAWLDTFEFQARGFYERLGYSCFGELNDYPTGFSRYFMTKTLASAVVSGNNGLQKTVID